MKEKIKTAIKAKFPALNLRAKRLEELTAKIEAKVKDEGEIDATIDAFNEFFPFSDIAKMDDKIADQENKLKKLAANPPTKEKTEDDDEGSSDDGSSSSKKKDKEKSDDAPAWAKGLTEGFKALSEKVGKLETEKVTASIQTQAKEKLKDVPEVFWAKRTLPTKVEDLEAFVTDVTTDYGVFEKAQTENGLSAVPKPKTGTGTPQNVPKADEKEVVAIVNKLMPDFVEPKKAS